MEATVVTPAGHACALWIGLNLLLLLVLSILVVRQRRRHRVLFGDEGVPELLRARRAFGNATEYLPPAMAGLVALALVGAAPWAIHGVGAVLFVGRLAHAFGISFGAGVSFGRQIGMSLTWFAMLFTGALLIFYAV
jgi:uncharacterized membrane protein YecN with MAPEG domain